MAAILFYLFLFGVPAAALIWAIVSLIVFVKTPKSSPKRQKRMVLLIVSAVLAIVSLAMLGLLFFIMAQIVKHM